MITLHILQLLSDNGFGTVAYTGNEVEADLFFEKLPLDKAGVYIVSRGAPLSRGQRTVQAFDLYARGVNDLEGGQKLEAILQYFTDTYVQCTLPIVPDYSDKEYKRVTVEPTSNVQNVGVDDTDRVIYVVSAQATYSK
jgi:hypothetical protein